MVIFKKLVDPSAGREKQGKAGFKTVAQTLPKIFCPALEILTLIGVTSSKLRALVNAGAPLKTLQISCDGGVTVNMVKWLRENVEVVKIY